MISNDIFIAAENSFNLFTLAKNIDATTHKEECGRLNVIGTYHLIVLKIF